MGLFSYNGRVRASMIGDKSALPDASDIPTLLEEFEREILDLSVQNNIPKKSVFCNDQDFNNN
jgi:hypothetical protein